MLTLLVAMSWAQNAQGDENVQTTTSTTSYQDDDELYTSSSTEKPEKTKPTKPDKYATANSDMTGRSVTRPLKPSKTEELSEKTTTTTLDDTTSDLSDKSDKDETDEEEEEEKEEEEKDKEEGRGPPVTVGKGYYSNGRGQQRPLPTAWRGVPVQETRTNTDGELVGVELVDGSFVSLDDIEKSYTHSDASDSGKRAGGVHYSAIVVAVAVSGAVVLALALCVLLWFMMKRVSSHSSLDRSLPASPGSADSSAGVSPQLVECGDALGVAAADKHAWAHSAAVVDPMMFVVDEPRDSFYTHTPVYEPDNLFDRDADDVAVGDEHAELDGFDAAVMAAAASRTDFTVAFDAADHPSLDTNVGDHPNNNSDDDSSSNNNDDHDAHAVSHYHALGVAPPPVVVAQRSNSPASRRRATTTSTTATTLTRSSDGAASPRSYRASSDEEEHDELFSASHYHHHHHHHHNSNDAMQGARSGSSSPHDNNTTNNSSASTTDHFISGGSSHRATPSLKRQRVEPDSCDTTSATTSSTSTSSTSQQHKHNAQKRSSSRHPTSTKPRRARKRKMTGRGLVQPVVHRAYSNIKLPDNLNSQHTETQLAAHNATASSFSNVFVYPLPQP